MDLTANAVTATPLGTVGVDAFTLVNNGSVTVYLHNDESGTTPAAVVVVAQGIPVVAGEKLPRMDPDGIDLAQWFLATATSTADVRLE